MRKSILLFLLFAGGLYASAQSTGKYQIKFLEINKQNSDYGIAILDNNKLIFTSAYEKVKSKRSYNPRKDLYVGDIGFNGEVTNIKPIVNKKDKKFNQTGAAYTSDGKTVYFSRSLYVNKKRKQKLPKNKRLEIYKASVKSDGSWSDIEKLPFNANEYSTGYPVLNKENTKLYFVSDRLPSLGGTDIFVVNISKEGNYGHPRNLGKNVNTSGNETTPFITDDNILYFSSDGHPGKGKLDVFAVEVFESATSEVYQLASPINSINDDFAYIINKDNNLGFFTSNRLQGKDFNDLYAFTLEKDVRASECFISVEGKVKDIDTKEVISGASVELYDLNGSLIESISTYNDGSYKFTVSCAKEYKIVASSVNYTKDEKHIEILEKNYHTTLHTNLNLNRIEEEKVVVETLQPIFYDFDDVTIKDMAAKKMDKIVKIMNDNPSLILEASAFTDSRGSNEYNRKLSQKRAKAAIEYIISKGIDKTRVKGRGFGEEKLRNQCVNGVECNEQDHQINRRTEFNFSNIQASIDSRRLTRGRQYTLQANRKSHNKTLKIKTQPPTKVVKSKPSANVNIAQTKKKPKTETKKSNIEESKTEAKIKPRKVNIAENYIEEQKGEIINKLSLLEKKYERVIADNSKLLDSALAGKQRVTEYKKSVENLEGTGWSNIINYKIDLKNFHKSYERLIGGNYEKNNSNIIDNKEQKVAIKNEEDSKKSKNITTKNVIKKSNKNLSVNKIEVVALQIISKGNYSQTNDAGKTDIIKVSFKVKQNKNVSRGDKDAHIVIRTPKGWVTDATGVFTPKDTNTEKKFTDHATIDYDYNDVNVVMYIERKGENYAEGIYPVELFIEGELVAISNLDLGNQELASSLISHK